MNSLGRIPLWCWYLFSVAFCYAIWNPYFSLYQVVQGDVAISVKALCVVVALIILSLYVAEGHRTLGPTGILLFVAFTGVVAWVAFDRGFRGFSSVHLWGQLVIALFLTMAVQGGRVYRALTGRVPTAGDVDHVAHH